MTNWKFNVVSRGARRATWRTFIVAIFISVCYCSGTKFDGISGACQSTYKSAWGHPKARQHALRLLQKTEECPSIKKISVRSHAALIAANHVPDASDDCYDSILAERLKQLCPNFPKPFRSHLWHAHADGHRQFGDRVHVELGLLVAISGLLLVVTISTECVVLVQRYTRPRLKLSSKDP